MSLIPLFALSFLSHLVLLSSAEEKKQNHPSCPKIFCDELGEFGFPFNNKTRPECGLYSVDCSEKIPKIQFRKGGHCFHVERISQYDSVLIMDISSPSRLNPCSCKSIETLSLPNASFSNISVRNPWTVFNCSRSLGITVPRDFHRTRCGGHGYDIYYTTFNASFPFAQQCSTIQLPPFSHRTPDNEILFLTNFTVEVLAAADCFTCHYEGGQCETNSKNKYYCSISTARKGHKDLALKLGLGVGLSLFVIGVIVFLLWRYKQKRSASQFLSRNSSDPYNNLVQEGGSTYFGVHVFAYEDLEEATNNFDRKNELGDGGFGTVYHGKLKDGREVAVKRLHEHNYKRVEQYINEIEILTRLRHTNLVSLWGCTSRHSKELLLVYEYIPNGTVADHLHGYRAQTSPLTWPIRMSIAIETATALAYLHASDIIHRDVKTKNILLDNNFCVKVADFGLSRPFPNDVTHVSTAPQGTPGYVDPEYHQCYHLTCKSDVYSFGVVLVELISSMPAVDMNRLRHEINLSTLALSKIQKGTYNELLDSRLGFDLDSEVKRMTIAVAELAFQCLQQDKEMRPSMDEVLEELQRIESGTHESENQVKGFDGVIVETQPSPDCDEVGLLKSKKEQPTSPNTVTENWHSSRSSTPNISH